MQTVESYISNLEGTQKEPFLKLRKIIKNNIQRGFIETINYKMLGYVVPLERYPEGYLGNSEVPLPFINLDIKKNGIHFYHLGLYNDPKLHEWFLKEWQAISKHKLDYGKSCFRFKYLDEIPFEAIQELVSKITLQEWIDINEKFRANRTGKKRAK